MRMNKTSRLLAVLLALLLALGSAPAALADGLVISSEQYAELSDAAVQEYYDALMAATTLDEYNAAVQDMTDEQWNSFVSKLSDEQKNAISAQVETMIQTQVAADTYPEVISAVNFSRVAPFMDPVVGTAPVARMMLMAANEEESNSGLKMSKTIAETGTDAYTITLEAWATGEKIITSGQEPVPTDIILVLDQSGSMTFCMYANCTTEDCSGSHQTGTYTETYSIVTSGNDNEYYYYNDGSYIRARYCNTCGGWYTQEHRSGNHRGTELTPKTSADSEGTQFYVPETKNYDIRKDALVDAVEAFVADVYKKAGGDDQDISTTADNVDHRIAIVGFASQSGYGNNTEILSVSGSNSGSVGVRYGSLNSTHYTNALQDVSTSAGQTMVNNAVAAIDAEGATQVDLGLDIANSIFENNKVPTGETRNRVVVVFTDGTPTSFSNYEAEVANGAISEAKTLKSTYGATVYSVGIFGGADGSNPSSLPANNDTGSNRENRFMHLVSSNYLTAESMTSTGSVNSKLENGKSYYLSASDKSTLMDIFTNIAKDIENSSVGTTLDESAVVKDVLTEQFELPENATTSSIKVYTADYTAADTFTNKTEYAATVTISGQTISVTNFDFAENWVGTETASDGTVTYRGKKLIIEIPIEVRDGFLGGNDVLTNAEGSGVYENADATEALDEFVSPTVDVVIKPITITTSDKNVYLYNDLTSDQILSDVVIKSGDVVIDPTKDNFGLASWQNAYVAVGSENSGGSLNDLTADTTYNVSCTIKPNSTGEATEQSKTESGTVNVFKPVLTFKDSEEKYLSAMEEADAATYFAANNAVSEGWKHGDTFSTDTDVTMTGTKPTLVLTYTPGSTLFETVGGKLTVTSQADVSVNVTVKIDDREGDINQYTASIRETCTCEKLNCSTCGFKNEEKTDYPILENDPEFVVHVYDVYGDLEINKEVKQDDFESGTFSFTVTGPNDYSKTVSIELKDKAITGSVLVEDLLPGDYTVTETTTNGYTVSESSVTATVKSNETAKVTFTNTASVNHKVTVTKIWDDASNALEYRPDSISLTLKGDGKEYTNAAITPTKSGNTWTYVFTVPKYDANGNTITYTVEETQVDKYAAPEYDQTKLTVKNSINVGNLAITKKVVNETGVTPAVSEFTFEVTLPKGEYSYTKTGVEGKQTLEIYAAEEGATTGTGRITLTDGQTVTFEALPEGTQYTVKESVPTGYEATKTGDTGTIVAGSTVTAAFTNTFKVADLTITKKIVDANGEVVTDENVKDDVFTFNVTIGGEAYKGTYYVGDKAYTAENGIVKITGQNSATIKDIPIKTGYIVTEINLPTGYSIADADRTVTGECAAEGSTATFTNTYAVGGLTISKTVVGTDAPADAKFTFTVELPAGKFTYTKSDKTTGTIQNGETIELKHGESVAITGIPNGASYTVTETADDDYTTLVSQNDGEKAAEAEDGTSGTIDADGEKVDYENTYKYGSLTIKKTGANETLDPNQTFLFTVKKADGTKVMDVVIKGNGRITIEHLPLGKYTVTEDTSWSWRYTCAEATQTGEVTATSNPTLTFNNEREEEQWLDGNAYAENNFSGKASN